MYPKYTHGLTRRHPWIRTSILKVEFPPLLSEVAILGDLRWSGWFVGEIVGWLKLPAVSILGWVVLYRLRLVTPEQRIFELQGKVNSLESNLVELELERNLLSPFVLRNCGMPSWRSPWRNSSHISKKLLSRLIHAEYQEKVANNSKRA